MLSSLSCLLGLLMLVPHPAISIDICNTLDNPVNVGLAQLNGQVWHVQETTFADTVPCTNITMVANEDGQTGFQNFSTGKNDKKKSSVSKVETVAPGVFKISTITDQKTINSTMTVVYYRKDYALVFHKCRICDGNTKNSFIIVATKDETVTEDQVAEIKKAACVGDDDIRKFKKVDRNSCDV